MRASTAKAVAEGFDSGANAFVAVAERLDSGANAVVRAVAEGLENSGADAIAGAVAEGFVDSGAPQHPSPPHNPQTHPRPPTKFPGPGISLRFWG